MSAHMVDAWRQAQISGTTVGAPTGLHLTTDVVVPYRTVVDILIAPSICPELRSGQQLERLNNLCNL